MSLCVSWLFHFPGSVLADIGWLTDASIVTWVPGVSNGLSWDSSHRLHVASHPPTGKPELLLMGAREQSEQSLLDLGSGLTYCHFCHFLLVKISHMDSPESRGGKKGPHLKMEGAVKSHCNGHEYKESGEMQGPFYRLIMIPLSRGGNRGSERFRDFPEVRKRLETDRAKLG